MVNDIDGWIYFDGPEPEPLRPLLDALRQLPPSTPEDKPRLARRLFEELDAELAPKGEPLAAPAVTAAPAATSARAPGARQEGEGDDVATTRSPSFNERLAVSPPAKPPSLPIDAREPHPPKGRAAEDLTTTTLPLELPAEVLEPRGGFNADRGSASSVPFKPRARGTELTRTMKVPVLNPRQGDTLPPQG